MEPLHPQLREALKQAHPGLTDQDVDRYEELLARRMTCDPEREAEQIERLDRERLAMLRDLMPRYAEVARAFAARRPRGAAPATPKVRTEIKRPEP